MGFRIMRINGTEPAADEKKLEEYSAKGEFISHYFGGLAYFRKGEPKKLRYSIELSEWPPSKKQKAFFKENGWDYVSGAADVNIYSSADENAASMYTDQSEYAHVIEKYHRSAGLLLAAVYIVCAACFLISMLLERLAGVVSVVYELAIESLLKLCGGNTICAAAPLIVDIIVSLMYHRSFVRAGAYAAARHENMKASEKISLRTKAVNIIGALSFALLISAAALFTAAALVSSAEDVPFSALPEAALTLEDAYGSGKVRTSDSLKEFFFNVDRDDYEFSEDDPNTALYKTSVITTENWSFKQYANFIDENGEPIGSLQADGAYYSFRTKFFAKIFFGDFIRWNFSESKNIREKYDVSGTAFDEAEVIRDKYSGEMHALLLRKGRDVYYLEVWDNGYDTENVIKCLSEAVK